MHTAQVSSLFADVLCRVFKTKGKERMKTVYGQALQAQTFEVIEPTERKKTVSEPFPQNRFELVRTGSNQFAKTGSQKFQNSVRTGSGTGFAGPVRTGSVKPVP